MVYEDGGGRPYRFYTVNRSPPGTILAPGPQGTALRLAAAAAISALISYFLARSLATPLGSLSKASRRIAAGELGTRVRHTMPSRQDEIGQLAVDFRRHGITARGDAEGKPATAAGCQPRTAVAAARLSVALEIARKKGAGHIGSEIDRISLESERSRNWLTMWLGLLRESSEPLSRLDDDIELTGLLTDLVEVVNYEVPEGKPGISWRPAGPCEFRGDRELLWRAMENLLRNALRHTDPDRGIELDLTIKKRKSRVELAVRDFGQGLPASELEKIFEPFYRVQESRDRGSGGHGLGLSIAANAARRHGGSMKRSMRPMTGWS